MAAIEDARHNRTVLQALRSHNPPGVLMPAQQYRKKPIVIEAMQWTGDNITDLWDWVGADALCGPLPVGDPLRPEGQPARLYVAANDAWLNLTVGEWIIRDALGFYPCNENVFATTYDPVNPS